VIKKVANYNLIEEIGRGAYGKVYLANKNGKDYAVKIIKI
jgi:serine/threonine protein kinase